MDGRSAVGGQRQIADYGLIGDCQTAALVDRNGSIDWLCWPRFDSDACFAALVGSDENGCWKISPASAFSSRRSYRANTLVLETLFETPDGEVALIDFMAERDGVSHVVRLVEGRRGRVAMRLKLILRFGYGRTVPWVSRLEDAAVCAVAGPSMVVLRTQIVTWGEDLATVAEFTISAGERVSFVLGYQASHLPPAPALDADGALRDCEKFWRGWVGRRREPGAYDEAIDRSLITLKAMTYAPTGGLVAAPTTSLPETFGGERNWDYRYSWIRDSTLTLLALMNAGHCDEAQAWVSWLHRAVAGDPADMQIMYGLGGERRLAEWEAGWLAGFADSKPVRIGNAAHSQVQLDVYGELMDTVHQARCAGLRIPDQMWAVQCALVEHVAKIWREPDEGIWEVRGGPKRFTYSRTMAWVAVDRAIKGSEVFGLEGPVRDWKALRKEISADVWANGFDAGRNTFVQSYGAPTLDASLLLLAHMGFLAPDDPAYVGTVEAIERELIVDGLVLRYRPEQTSDGLHGREGVFLACSFWLADAYAMIGRGADATRVFEVLLSLRNDLGLLSEEYDPIAKRLAGNFPQAFSHIGLVNTAFNLTRVAKPMRQRANSSPAA